MWEKDGNISGRRRPEGARWATPANALTGVRLAAAPALAAAIVCDAAATAAALFALAVATDLADGPLARRRGEVSPLGGLLDHASDALLCTSGLAALAARGVLTPLLPLLVALAFLQYTWDSRVVRGQRLRASSLGRWNGVAYYVMVGIPVVRDALGVAWPGAGLVAALAWALVASTLVSMADRVRVATRLSARADRRSGTPGRGAR